MKKLIAIAALLGTVSAFAGTSTYFGNVSVKSSVSEADLVLKAEALIPGIENFTNREIRRDARMEGCWPLRARDIKMGSMSIKKFYKSNDGVTFAPYWIGSISYTVKSCRDRD